VTGRVYYQIGVKESAQARIYIFSIRCILVVKCNILGTVTWRKADTRAAESESEGILGGVGGGKSVPTPTPTPI
jgi:hypothetical protein